MAPIGIAYLVGLSDQGKRTKVAEEAGEGAADAEAEEAAEHKQIMLPRHMVSLGQITG